MPGHSVASIGGTNPQARIASIFGPKSTAPPAPSLRVAPAGSPVRREHEDLLRPRPDPTRRVDDPPFDEITGNPALESDCEDDPETSESSAQPTQTELPDSTLPEDACHIPEFVMAAFEMHKTNIRKHSNFRSIQPKSYYDVLQSFWLPHTHPFFYLNKPAFSPASLLVPRFFYWDPHALVAQIHCPKPTCVGLLKRHGFIELPRRVLDLNGVFYLIGVRYQCTTCNQTFNSWDARVLKRLPSYLSSHFPARLTHRSGMSDELFAMLRLCFQNGMGGKQFADSLNALYRRRHEQLEVSFLEAVIAQGAAGKEYDPFPSYEEGCARAPSARYCRDMYDDFIEEIAHLLDQHMAQLSTRGMAIDHSHKITKHIAKVLGEAVFCGLLTMTNEFGEIRICDLVPTKAHSQFDLALKRMSDSIRTYGMEPPKVIFTDNMADKRMLEEHFPSLKTGVHPVLDNDLPFLTLPDNVEVRVCQTWFQVNAAILGLVDLIPEAGTGKKMVVGLDTEWDVDLDARQGGIPDRRQTAIMQIAHGTSIWIFQLTSLIEAGTIPSQLIAFLANSQVLKVGKNVALDLKFLQDDFESPNPFVGGVDIAQLAKSKNMVKNAGDGLANLCQKILSRTLNKDHDVRVSASWSARTLSERQLEYAALDVWASLKVYETLIAIQCPMPLDFTAPIPPNLPVYLYHSDRTSIIARGVISSQFVQDSGTQIMKWDGINVTKTRVIVQVEEIYVPGAIIDVHHQRPLNAFGPTPFNLVATRNHVRTYVPGFVESHTIPPNPTRTLPSDSPISSELDPLQEHADSVAYVQSEDPDMAGVDLGFNEESSELRNAPPSQTVEASLSDRDIATLYEDILKELIDVPWAPEVRSGVLKDIFHVFHMIFIPKNHGLRVTFARILRDAIFLPDVEDKRRMIAYLARLPTPKTWEEAMRTRPQFIKRYVKFVVPPPEQLYRLVKEIFRVYGPLQDAQTGQPLFGRSTLKTVKSILEYIKLGYISDPPNIPLYYPLGVCSVTGLTRYRCWRGTNFTEGGVHRPIRHSMPISGVSPRHTANRLKDFGFRHNMRTGTYNTTGLNYTGHFDIQLINRRQQLLNSEAIRQAIPKSSPVANWVNGSMYVQTTEVFGILPIPDNVRVATGLLAYDPHDKPKAQPYLAQQQGTKFATLTVHTNTEHQLYSQLMREDPLFTRPEGPDWPQATRRWNELYANGKDIFYKVRDLRVWRCTIKLTQDLCAPSFPADRASQSVLCQMDGQFERQTDAYSNTAALKWN